MSPLFKNTIQWRFIAVALTFLITYLWTGKIMTSLGLGITLNVVKTVAFYFWLKWRNL